MTKPFAATNTTATAAAVDNALSTVTAELTAVEERIDEVLLSREPRITEIANYLIEAGGKRVRPAVALLVFRACGGSDPRDVVDLSVALELIHSATLLHDDIIDSSDTRRGRASAPKRFGMPDTLVTGDFLFSRAFEICGRFEEQVVAWAAQACVQLTEGEVLQRRFRHNPAVTERDYEEIISRKTASLFSAGARIACHLAGQSATDVERLAGCGQEIGLAFQMIDDVLDVTGEAESTGKDRGADLRDGNPSLPVVWGLELAAVRTAFIETAPGQPEVAAALLAIEDAGLPRRIRELAAGHAARAEAVVESLEPSEHQRALLLLISALIDREF